jgi:ankyrin repeat protein
MKKPVLLSLLLVMFCLMCICPARATVVADRAHVIKERMDFLESSLISQKKAKGTYLGVISSNMGKQAVDVINSSGSDIIKISTSKNAFCMMYGEYCVDYTGFKGQGTGCSNSNIACKPAFDRAKLVERIRQLIEERRKMSDSDRALLEAVISQNLDGVRSALKAGANPNVKREDVPVIFIAVAAEDDNIVKELIKAGADVNAVLDGYAVYGLGEVSLLTYASYENTHLEALLEAGADPNVTQSPYGVTPAMLALINSDQKKGLGSLKLLLKYGANPNSKVLKGIDVLVGQELSAYMEGMNLVNIAALANNTEAFNELVKAGGDINNKSVKGVDSLLFNLFGLNLQISTNKSIDIVKSLLSSSVDVNNEVTIQGQTVSSMALAIKFPEVLEMLIKAGADVNRPGYVDGVMIKSSYLLFIAMQEEENEAVKILEKAGAVLSKEDKKLLGDIFEDEKDVKVKSWMSQMRSAAELAKIEAGGESYKDLGDEFAELLSQLNETCGVNNFVRKTPVTYRDWCLSVVLPTSGTNWCVDSNGYVGEPTNSDTCDLSYRCVFGERRPEEVKKAKTMSEVKDAMNQMRAAAAFYSANHNYSVWKDGDMDAPSAPATAVELVSDNCSFSKVNTTGVDITTAGGGRNILEDSDFKTLCMMSGAIVVLDANDNSSWCASINEDFTFCVDSDGYAGGTNYCKAGHSKCLP